MNFCNCNFFVNSLFSVILSVRCNAPQSKNPFEREYDYSDKGILRFRGRAARTGVLGKSQIFRGSLIRMTRGVMTRGFGASEDSNASGHSERQENSRSRS